MRFALLASIFFSVSARALLCFSMSCLTLASEAPQLRDSQNPLLPGWKSRAGERNSKWLFGPGQQIGFQALVASLGYQPEQWHHHRTTRVRQTSIHEYHQRCAGQPVHESALRLYQHAENGLICVFIRGLRSPHAPPKWNLSTREQQSIAATLKAPAEDMQAGWEIDHDGRAIASLRWLEKNAAHQQQTQVWDIAQQQLLKTIPGVMHGGITGRAMARVSRGWDPETSGRFLSWPLKNALVELVGQETTLSDEQGQFSLSGSGSTRLTLQGPYVQVINELGQALSFETITQPGDNTLLLLNTLPSEESTAQVNAFVHANIAHDWIRALPLDPPFTQLDFPLSVMVNRDSGSCNAVFDPSIPAIVFFTSGGDCPNSAFSTVIYHEYWHAIAYQIFGTFFPIDMHEGIADAGAAMISSDRTIGRDFYALGEHLRDVEQDLVFPVAAAAHIRGLVVAGSVYDFRTRCIHELGYEEGTRLAERIWVESLFFIPTGINADMVTTLLLADDDDGDLSNGTPHDDWIIESFQIHGLLHEPILVEPIRDLIDVISDEQVQFSWTNPSTSYDGIEIEKNGEWVTTLLPGQNTWIDPFPSAGQHSYCFTPISTGIAAPKTPRLVAIRHFIRGDVDGDYQVSFVDAIQLLQISFGMRSIEGCSDVADVNEDGTLNLDDAVGLLNYLFISGEAPRSPFPEIGLDLEEDLLPCAGEI